MVERSNMARARRDPKSAQPGGLNCEIFHGLWRGFCLFILLVSAAPMMARAVWLRGSLPEATGTTQTIQNQSDVRDLVPGMPIERELAGGETHVYRVALAAGQYLRVVVDQRGVDVVVRLIGPDGQQITEVNGRHGTQGLEPVSLVTEMAGTYRLEVRSVKKETVAGRYEVKIEEIRWATVEDNARVAAERTFAEGGQLQRQGTAESRRAAIEKYEAALPLWRTAEDRFKEAETLNNIGVVYALLGEPQKALEYYDQALALRRAVGDRQGEAETLNNIGTTCWRLGQYQKALDYYSQALPLWRAIGDRRGEAATLNGIGTVYNLSGEMQTALEYYDQALSLHRAVGNRRGEAYALTNMGMVYNSLGELQKALEYYDQALSLHRALGDRHGEAETLNNLGVTHDNLGEKQKALEYYGQALERRRVVGDRRGEAQTLSNIGVVYKDLGELQKALEYYSQALLLRRAVGDRRGEGYTLHNIGGVYDRLGEDLRVLEYYGQALALWQVIGERRGEAGTLHGLGRLYNELGDLQKAIEYYDRALRLWQAVGERQREAATLHGLGTVYDQLGERQKALDYCNQALSLSRAVGDRFGEAAALFSLARVERDRSHLTEARAQIESALHITESLRAKVASQELRASYLASVRGSYEFYVDLLMQLHQVEPSKGYATMAFQASERARARSLLDLLAEANIELQQGIAPALKRRERDTHARIAWIQRQLIQAQSGPSPDERAIAQLEEQLKQIEREREQLEIEIKRNHPRYAELQYPTPLGLKAIQDLLDEQTALLEYALGEDRSFLFAITKTDYSVVELPPASSIADQVKQLRETLITKPQRQHFPTYIEQARSLHQALVEPARKFLAEKKHLLIVPDGILHYLPFEVLLSSGDEKNLTTVGPRRWPYLVRDYAISYVPSANVLASLPRFRQAKPEQQKVFLAYADPAYGSAELTDTNPLRSALRSAFGEARPWQLERLTYSREEANRIAALYPPDKVRLFLQQDAREENVKVEGQLSQYRFIHFAAHGLLSENKPQYSGLVLSLPPLGGSRPKTQDSRPTDTAAQAGSPHEQQTKDQGPRTKDTVEDGLLQVYEIFDLKLNADLVVLSACETGLGKEVKGEGLIGLTRAFLYAGTPSVVVSLWKVSDRSTAELMVSLYQHLKESAVSKAEALQQAQLKLIQKGRYAHPYYWAPFVLVGEVK